jgi:hypothetical protein
MSTVERIGQVGKIWATRGVKGWTIFIHGRGMVARNLNDRQVKVGLASLGVVL